MAGQLAVTALQPGHFIHRKGCPHHRRLEIVGHHGSHHTPQLGKGLHMQLQPGLDPLVEDQPDHHLAAVTQHQGKDPGLAQLAARGIEDLAHIAEIHLGDLAGRRLHGDHHVLRFHRQRTA